MDAPSIDRLEAPAEVAHKLEGHPKIKKVSTSVSPIIRFWVGDWERRLFIGNSDCAMRGVIELIDNNPVICCDEFSLPHPFAHALSLAAGPLSLSGISVDTVSVVTNLEIDLASDGVFLQDIYLPLDFARVRKLPSSQTDILVATLQLSQSLDGDDLKEVFSQRFEGAFFVSDRPSTYPCATYSLSAIDSPGLVTVHIESPQGGKFGVAGQIHALNVMLGFDEGLGLFGV